MPTSDPPPQRPGRDPGGRVAYLPPRAAKARKLILRSQLGRGWILASALFGLVILVAGVLFLTRDGRPGLPWVRVASLSSLPAGSVTEVAGPGGQVVVVDRRDGELRAFLAPPGPAPASAGTGAAPRPASAATARRRRPRCAGSRSRSPAATCTSTPERRALAASPNGPSVPGPRDGLGVGWERPIPGE